MAIYLDTSSISDIKKYLKMGIISGVTTNPTILMKEGIKGGMHGLKSAIQEVTQLVAPYPVSVEVTSHQASEMLKQAKEFAGWADNIVVKIAIHGPKGENESLEVVHELEHKHNIRVNVTAMMSAQQCYIAALAGASYVSILSGRVNNMGYNSIEEIKKLRQLLDQEQLKSKIIAASTREIINVSEWILAGAHIVTVIPSFIEGMIVHPYSKETVQMFLNDAQKAGH